jgi:hypothetical protein
MHLKVLSAKLRDRTPLADNRESTQDSIRGAKSPHDIAFTPTREEFIPMRTTFRIAVQIHGQAQQLVFSNDGSQFIGVAAFRFPRSELTKTAAEPIVNVTRIAVPRIPISSTTVALAPVTGAQHV